ncbi:MAG: tetratricopeptide repeat protein [bacterium]
MNCPRCGYSNQETANFCSRCGLQLIKTPGQRRPVAIIFADISGFTPLSEKHDPEEVKDLIDYYLQRLARVIQNYEGYVDKFIGDCIMALFGAPIAHEDDTLRAVLAGLDLLREIANLNREKKQKLSLSIGINYGLVATGDLGRPGGYTVMGDAVNLAERLQRAAPHGKIYVSEEVYKNTYREIVYKKLGKISVKGRKEKILIYMPIKARAKYGQRKMEEIPLIGRTAELNCLNKIFQETKSGRGRIVAIIGEAGIGKTKLVYEFKKHLDKNIFVVEGKGIEYHSNSTYFVLRELLKKVFGIADADTPVEISNRISTFLEKLGDAVLRIKLPYYKYFLAADLTKSERNHFDSMKVEDRSRLLLEAINRLFMKLASINPLVLILDDCHWIDQETLEFINELAGAIGYKPIFILYLFRPGVDISKIKHLPYFNILELKPLAENETITLLKTLIGCDKIANNLLNLLLDKSGSIPFYTSELVTNLINNNIIYVRNGIAQMKEDMTISIPRSLDELIMTKVDKLAPELRYIVNIAAVIGEQFSFKLLNALIPGRERLRQNLDYIMQQNIIQLIGEKDSTGEEKFSFSHSIIRDAVYNSLLKKQQKEYHKKVGYVMENIYNLTIEEYFDTLSNHFYLGGDINKAVEYMEKSGDQKKELYLNDAAIEIYKKCLSMIPDSMPSVTARIYEKLGGIYELIGNYEIALGSFRNIDKYAEGDLILSSRSLRRQANVIKNLGDYEGALELLSKARIYLKSAKEPSDKKVLMELSNIISLECWLYRIKGKMEVAEKKGLEAIGIVKGIKDWQGDIELKQTLNRAYNNLSVVYCIKGDFAQAIELCQKALANAEEIGDLRSKVDAYNIMGTVFKAQGDYERAIDSFTMNLKITQDLGDKRGISVAYCNLGNVYQHKGEYTTALDLYQKLLEISQELGDKPNIGVALNNMGAIYFNLGNYEKALKFFVNYLKTSQELGDKRGEAIAYGNMGEVLRNRFEYKKAETFLKKYLRISMHLGDKRGIGIASHNLGQVYTEIGRLKLADKYLNEALKIFENLNNKILLGLVKNSIAYVKMKKKEIEESLNLLHSTLQLAEETQSEELKADCFFNLGRAYRTLDEKKARQFFDEAVRLCEKNRYQKLLADIYYEYAKLLQPTQKKEAKKYFDQSEKIYNALRIKKKQLKI